MRKTRVIVFAAAMLTSCSLFPTSTQNSIDSFLGGLANKTTVDLTTALKVANTPAPNLPGGIVGQADVECLQGSAAPTSIGGLLGAQKLVNNLLANAKGGGAVTAGEIATFILPGSPQMNALTTGIITDCGPKMQQVNASVILGTGAWFTALGAQFAIAMAPLGG